jgi:hypothetical protein
MGFPMTRAKENSLTYENQAPNMISNELNEPTCKKTKSSHTRQATKNMLNTKYCTFFFLCIILFEIVPIARLWQRVSFIVN